jgi:hypothetical protein
MGSAGEEDTKKFAIEKIFAFIIVSDSSLQVSCRSPHPFQQSQTSKLKQLLTPEEYQLLQDLLAISPAQNPPQPKLSLGDRIADRVAATMGSLPFILVQSLLLALWITLNSLAFIKH